MVRRYISALWGKQEPQNVSCHGKLTKMIGDSEEQTKYSQSFEDAIPIGGSFLRGIYLLRSEGWEGPRSRA